MKELNTRICSDCKKTFRTPGQDQLCHSCKEKHRKKALKKQCEQYKNVYKKKESPKPEVSLADEQKVERIYNAIHKDRYRQYGEIVNIIENTKADRCVCCGDIVPEGRLVCPNCERRAANE